MTPRNRAHVPTDRQQEPRRPRRTTQRIRVALLEASRSFPAGTTLILQRAPSTPPHPAYPVINRCPAEVERDGERVTLVVRGWPAEMRYVISAADFNKLFPPDAA